MQNGTEATYVAVKNTRLQYRYNVISIYVHKWNTIRFKNSASDRFCTNLFPHSLPSSVRTDSTDFTTGPFLLSISVLCF